MGSICHKKISKNENENENKNKNSSVDHIINEEEHNNLSKYSISIKVSLLPSKDIKNNDSKNKNSFLYRTCNSISNIPQVIKKQEVSNCNDKGNKILASPKLHKHKSKNSSKVANKIINQNVEIEYNEYQFPFLNNDQFNNYNKSRNTVGFNNINNKSIKSFDDNDNEANHFVSYGESMITTNSNYKITANKAKIFDKNKANKKKNISENNVNYEFTENTKNNSLKTTNTNSPKKIINSNAFISHNIAIEKPYICFLDFMNNLLLIDDLNINFRCIKISEKLGFLYFIESLAGITMKSDVIEYIIKNIKSKEKDITSNIRNMNNLSSSKDNTANTVKSLNNDSNSKFVKGDSSFKIEFNESILNKDGNDLYSEFKVWNIYINNVLCDLTYCTELNRVLFNKDSLEFKYESIFYT